MMPMHLLDTDRYRRDDMMRAAARHRAAANLRAQAAPLSVVRPLLRWTGRRLVSAGFRLLVLTREWEHRANTVYNEVSLAP